MELSYNELRKRDVVNVSDGRCLGRIIDMRLCFPEGVLTGIVVPGRKTRGFFRWFDKSQLYIDESRIIKIGGDVILVDVNCGEMCAYTVRGSSHQRDGGKNNNKSSCKPKPCPPPCPEHKHECNDKIDFSILSGGNCRIDTDDY